MAPDAPHTDSDGAAAAVPPMGRRCALSLIAGLGAATLAACSGRGGGDSAGADAASTTSTTTAGGPAAPHVEVFASLADATGGGTPIAISQIALPEDTCALAYATDGYDQSSRNMARTSLESDNVFGDDGGVDQLATVTGSVRDGFVASLTVPV